METPSPISRRGADYPPFTAGTQDQGLSRIRGPLYVSHVAPRLHCSGYVVPDWSASIASRTASDGRSATAATTASGSPLPTADATALWSSVEGKDSTTRSASMTGVPDCTAAATRSRSSELIVPPSRVSASQCPPHVRSWGSSRANAENACWSANGGADGVISFGLLALGLAGDGPRTPVMVLDTARG